MGISSLSAMVFVPAAGALLLSAFPGETRKAQRWFAVMVSLIPLALAVEMWRRFDNAYAGFQFVERSQWISRLGVSYFVGVDGVSLLLVLLTAFLTPLVVYASADSVHQRFKAYLVAMLLLETTMLGALVALDTLLFYVFWELMLVPMFLIIGIWGGKRRVYAAIKFVLFTMVGSLPMLVAIVWIALAHGHQVGQVSFALTDWYGLQLSSATQAWACAAMIVAFAIKVPMWPLHTWLPDAHVEAPTGGSVILAGVLLKMGTYGFYRFVLPLFPDALPLAMQLVGTLAVVGIVYGALVAMVQPDMKKLVAYSSVSHLGFVMLGLASLEVIGVEGAVYQMIAHGLSTGALFLLVGMIYERRHTRLIADFGGLWKQLPLYSACFLVVMLASIGLPGLCGFVGEFLILVGSFRTQPLLAVVAVSGVVLGAVYMLWMYQRVMFGELDESANGDLDDMRSGELLTLAPVLALIVVMGVYPRPFLDTMKTSVEVTLAHASGDGTAGTRVISAAAAPAVALADDTLGECDLSPGSAHTGSCSAAGGLH